MPKLSQKPPLFTVHFLRCCSSPTRVLITQRKVISSSWIQATNHHLIRQYQVVSKACLCCVTLITACATTRNVYYIFTHTLATQTKPACLDCMHVLFYSYAHETRVTLKRLFFGVVMGKCVKLFTTFPALAHLHEYYKTNHPPPTDFCVADVKADSTQGHTRDWTCVFEINCL